MFNWPPSKIHIVAIVLLGLAGSALPSFARNTGQAAQLWGLLNATTQTASGEALDGFEGPGVPGESTDSKVIQEKIAIIKDIFSRHSGLAHSEFAVVIHPYDQFVMAIQTDNYRLMKEERDKNKALIKIHISTDFIEFLEDDNWLEFALRHEWGHQISDERIYNFYYSEADGEKYGGYMLRKLKELASTDLEHFCDGWAHYSMLRDGMNPKAPFEMFSKIQEMFGADGQSPKPSVLHDIFRSHPKESERIRFLKSVELYMETSGLFARSEVENAPVSTTRVRELKQLVASENYEKLLNDRLTRMTDHLVTTAEQRVVEQLTADPYYLPIRLTQLDDFVSRDQHGAEIKERLEGLKLKVRTAESKALQKHYVELMKNHLSSVSPIKYPIILRSTGVLYSEFKEIEDTIGEVELEALSLLRERLLRWVRYNLTTQTDPEVQSKLLTQLVSAFEAKYKEVFTEDKPKIVGEHPDESERLARSLTDLYGPSRIFFEVLFEVTKQRVKAANEDNISDIVYDFTKATRKGRDDRFKIHSYKSDENFVELLQITPDHALLEMENLLRGDFSELDGLDENEDIEKIVQARMQTFDFDGLSNRSKQLLISNRKRLKSEAYYEQLANWWRSDLRSRLSEESVTQLSPDKQRSILRPLESVGKSFEHEIILLMSFSDESGIDMSDLREELLDYHFGFFAAYVLHKTAGSLPSKTESENIGFRAYIASKEFEEMNKSVDLELGYSIDRPVEEVVSEVIDRVNRMVKYGESDYAFELKEAVERFQVYFDTIYSLSRGYLLSADEELFASAAFVALGEFPAELGGVPPLKQAAEMAAENTAITSVMIQGHYDRRDDGLTGKLGFGWRAVMSRAITNPDQEPELWAKIEASLDLVLEKFSRYFSRVDKSPKSIARLRVLLKPYQEKILKQIESDLTIEEGFQMRTLIDERRRNAEQLMKVTGLRPSEEVLFQFALSELGESFQKLYEYELDLQLGQSLILTNNVQQRLAEHIWSKRLEAYHKGEASLTELYLLNRVLEDNFIGLGTSGQAQLDELFLDQFAEAAKNDSTQMARVVSLLLAFELDRRMSGAESSEGLSFPLKEQQYPDVLRPHRLVSDEGRGMRIQSVVQQMALLGKPTSVDVSGQSLWREALSGVIDSFNLKEKVTLFLIVRDLQIHPLFESFNVEELAKEVATSDLPLFPGELPQSLEPAGDSAPLMVNSKLELHTLLIPYMNQRVSNESWERYLETLQQSTYDSNQWAYTIAATSRKSLKDRFERTNRVAEMYRLNREGLDELEDKTLNSRYGDRVSDYAISKAFRSVAKEHIKGAIQAYEFVQWLRGHIELGTEAKLNLLRPMAQALIPDDSGVVGGIAGERIGRETRNDRELRQSLDTERLEAIEDKILSTYRESTIAVRMAMIDEFVTNANKTGIIDSERGRELLIDFALDGFPSSKLTLAKEFFLGIFESYEPEEQHFLAAQIIASASLESEAEITVRDGERVAKLLESKGGLFIRLAQRLSSRADVIPDNQFRADLQVLNDGASHPYWSDFLKLMEKSMGSEYEKVISVEEIMGSGSMNIVALLTFKDGSRRVARFIRGTPEVAARNDELRIRRAIEHYRRRAGELASGDPELSSQLLKVANSFAEYLPEIVRVMQQEANLNLERELREHIAPSYTQAYSDIAVGSVLSDYYEENLEFSDAESISSDRAAFYIVGEVIPLSDLSDEEVLRTRTAMYRMAVRAAEVDGKFDPDSHLGNFLVVDQTELADWLKVMRIDFSQATEFETSAVHSGYRDLLKELWKLKNPWLSRVAGLGTPELQNASGWFLQLIRNDSLNGDSSREVFERSFSQAVENTPYENSYQFMEELRLRISETLGLTLSWRPSVTAALTNIQLAQQILDAGVLNRPGISQADLDVIKMQEFVRTTLGLEGFRAKVLESAGAISLRISEFLESPQTEEEKAAEERHSFMQQLTATYYSEKWTVDRIETVLQNYQRSPTEESRALIADAYSRGAEQDIREAVRNELSGADPLMLEILRRRVFESHFGWLEDYFREMQIVGNFGGLDQEFFEQMAANTRVLQPGEYDKLKYRNIERTLEYSNTQILYELVKATQRFREFVPDAFFILLFKHFNGELESESLRELAIWWTEHRVSEANVQKNMLSLEADIVNIYQNLRKPIPAFLSSYREEAENLAAKQEKEEAGRRDRLQTQLFEEQPTSETMKLEPLPQSSPIREIFSGRALWPSRSSISEYEMIEAAERLYKEAYEIPGDSKHSGSAEERAYRQRLLRLIAFSHSYEFRNSAREQAFRSKLRSLKFVPRELEPYAGHNLNAVGRLESLLSQSGDIGGLSQPEFLQQHLSQFEMKASDWPNHKGLQALQERHGIGFLELFEYLRWESAEMRLRFINRMEMSGLIHRQILAKHQDWVQSFEENKCLRMLRGTH